MGDFEDVFGVGADAGSIIEGYSRYHEDDVCEEETELVSGAGIEIARSFYQVNGTIHFPTDNALHHLPPPDIARLDAVAREALSSFEAALTSEQRWCTFNEERPVVLQKHIRDAAKSCRDLVELEALLMLLVKYMDEPAVLVRDASAQNGLLGASLSTHAIALGEEFFVARFGDLEIQGPFRRSLGSSWERYRYNSYESLANGRSGREVLMISKCLLDPMIPIANADDWIHSVRCGSENISEGQGHTMFDDISRFAAASEGNTARLRNWSNTREAQLTWLVRHVSAAITAPEARFQVSLTASLNGKDSRLGVHFVSNLDDDEKEALELVLGNLVDVTMFRGRTVNFPSQRSPEVGALCVKILDTDRECLSVHEKVAGISVLLDLFEAKGLDRAVAAEALAGFDAQRLILLLNPETATKADLSQRFRYDPGREVDFTDRVGMKDLPY